MDAPIITGRIEAWPVVFFAWACPKCNGMHARVPAGETVTCLNPKCGEVYDRSLFRFVDGEKIRNIIQKNADKLETQAMREIAAEAEKVEAV